MQNELKKSRQYFRSVGTVYELNLELKDSTDPDANFKIKCKDKDGNEFTTDGERIIGNIAIRTQRGIQTFNVFFQSIGYDGTPAKNWKMALGMLSWSPEINANGEEPTRVAIEGQIAINDYVKDGNVYSNLRWRVSKATTKVGDDEPTGTSLDAVCYVHKIEAEKINEEETGRLKVTLMGADNKGACFPIDVIVEKDLADAVEENIEIGTTLPVTLNRNMRHIGGDKKKGGKRMIGGSGDVNVNTGFDVEELILVGADDPIEEPEETEDEDGNPIEDKSGYINPTTMKKAIKVRAAMLDELKANPPERKGKSESFEDKKKKAAGKGKTVGKGANKPPFDMGDDDDGDPDF